MPTQKVRPVHGLPLGTRDGALKKHAHLLGKVRDVKMKIMERASSGALRTIPSFMTN
jgi:hypothetical protein